VPKSDWWSLFLLVCFWNAAIYGWFQSIYYAVLGVDDDDFA